MDRVEYVQTVLTEKEIQKLLEKAETKSKKDALRKAVLHYINCPYEVSNDV